MMSPNRLKIDELQFPKVSPAIDGSPEKKMDFSFTFRTTDWEKKIEKKSKHHLRKGQNTNIDHLCQRFYAIELHKNEGFAIINLIWK